MSSAGSGMLAVPQTLADMLAKNAWKYPDQTAFVWGDRRVTHARASPQGSQACPPHCGPSACAGRIVSEC